ncbi:MAG: hypothetical protein QXD29_00825 [Thermoplasmata archaeon]
MRLVRELKELGLFGLLRKRLGREKVVLETIETGGEEQLTEAIAERQLIEKRRLRGI